jgi:hypothetical protein
VNLQIKKALYEIDATESSLSTPDLLTGMKNLLPKLQLKLTKAVRGMLYDLRKCIEEMKTNVEEIDIRKKICHKILEDQYRIFHNARSVSNFLSTSSIAGDYERIALELIGIIRKAKYEAIPILIEWTDYGIDLKEFEAKYRDGASENHKLHELLKSRKLIQVESIEQVRILYSLRGRTRRIWHYQRIMDRDKYVKGARSGLSWGHMGHVPPVLGPERPRSALLGWTCISK